MELTDRILGGLAIHGALIPAFFVLGVLTLLFSMVAASWFGGGIAFGSIRDSILKGGGLVAVITCINLLPWGLLIAGPIWFFGLMFLFDLSLRETRLLTQINWGMNCVWKVLLVILMM